MNTHTSLVKVDEVHHFSFPHLARNKSIKKSLLEDLSSHRTTPQWPIISPLDEPCLRHVLELISGQLGLLTCGQPHTKEYLIDLIDKIIGVFFNLRPVKGRMIHPSEFP